MARPTKEKPVFRPAMTDAEAKRERARGEAAAERRGGVLVKDTKTGAYQIEVTHG